MTTKLAKKIIITSIITLLFSIYLATGVFATQYIITTVEMNAVLNEDRSIDITETYSGYLDGRYESIFVELPLTDTISTSSGDVPIDIDISDIEMYHIVGEEREKLDFTTSVEGDDLIVTTRGTTFESGNTVISINYRHSLGPDNTVGADELFFLVVRPERYASMGSVLLTFEFPKPITEDMVSVTSSVGENSMSYNLDGNILTANNLLSIPEAHNVLLHAVLEDEYFLLVEETIFSFNPLIYTFCGAILGLALLVGVLTRTKHRVKSGVVTHPPVDFSPIELLLMTNRTLGRRSVLGAVIALASAGAVRLSFGERGLVITKGNDVALPTVSKNLFDLLFEDGDNTMLDKDGLDALIPKIGALAKENLNRSHELQDNLAYGLCSAFIILCGVVGGVLVGIGYGLDYGMTRLLIMAVTVGLPLIIGGHIMQSGFARSRKKRSTILHFLGLILSLAATIWGAILMQTGSDPIMILLLVATYLVTVLVASSGRGSRYNAEVLSDLASLNRFLSAPSDDTLQKILVAEPNYLYNVFAHSVCFNCEDKILAAVAKLETDLPESEFMPSPFELQSVIPRDA